MDKQTLENLRHSTAHLLAAAVKQIWPDAKNAIGPSIDAGFYQDFDMGDTKLSEDDLPKIQDKMREIVKEWKTFEVKEVTSQEARKDFSDNPYKLELIEEFAKEGKKLTENNPGNFLDLCKGGHTENPSKEIHAFQLLSLAGAYWRGDEKNKMLTRIYGTAFSSKKELDEYLTQLEEAKKRDHRKLGQELDLFVFSDLVGSGLPMYTPKGTIIIEEIKNALREISKKYNMQLVSIPHLAKIELYQKSGHAEKFSDELFYVKSHYDQEFVMKPVNCPHHTQIYASRPRSYKDLPIRYIEQTMQYRDEKPGQIGGLQRTRGFTVDDGHTFCRVDQIKEEASMLVEVIQEFYENLGLWGKHWISLSVRDKDANEKYIGTSEDWEKAEKMLEQISNEYKLNAKRMEGEAALYGPKLDFMFKDALGRETQLATVQLDFAMPKRFDLHYIDEKGEKQTPVMIHRAILGSFERFMMLLIEHFGGAFPLWLSPVQITLLPISDKHIEFAQKVNHELKEQGIRSEVDTRSERLQAKIRDGALQKIPFMGIIGDKEIEADSVSVRARGGEDLGSLKIASLIDKIKENIDKKI